MADTFSSPHRFVKNNIKFITLNDLFETISSSLYCHHSKMADTFASFGSSVSIFEAFIFTRFIRTNILIFVVTIITQWQIHFRAFKMFPVIFKTFSFLHVLFKQYPHHCCCYHYTMADTFASLQRV